MIKKIIKTLIFLVLALVVIGSVYLFAKLPNRSGDLTFSELSEPVNIWFDEWAIPHIEAQNKDDLYFSFGYLHAQDRLFQMEIMRRLSQGKLAEILGEDLVDVDKLFRRLSIHHYSKQWQIQVLEQASDEILSAVDKYLEGVNAYARENSPIEFDILGIPKHEYKLEDILSIAGYMGWSFAQALKEDPVVEFVAQNFGDSYLADLATHINETTRTIPISTLESLTDLARFPMGVSPFIGSNSWVLSGEKTQSGNVLFVNDPHMVFAQPSVWYEAHLSTPDFELYGHHIGLVPFAIMGHNSDLAWGITMFENDDMDLFQEKVNPSNSNQYWAVDQWLEFERREESIAVKSSDPIDFDVLTTRHGPVINESFDLLTNEPNQPISLWWQFLQPGNRILEGLWELPQAKNIELAYSAVEKIQAPGLNLMYGNAIGDIAWFAAARLPIRPDHVNSKRILDGASGRDDYLGYLDFSDNPMSINPDTGFVYSANNQPAGNETGIVPGYYAPRDRADRINFLLDNSIKHDVDSMKKMLLDSKSPTAQQLIKLLMQAMETSEDNLSDNAKLLAEIFFSWDTTHSPDSIEPTLYNRFRATLQTNLFADELSEKLYGAFSDSFLQDRSLWSVTENKLSPWWDNKQTQNVETWQEITQVSWQETIDGLTEDLGDASDTWLWSRAAVLAHNHALGVIKPLNKLFNVGPFHSNGGVEVINNLSVSYDTWPYEVTSGPSTRRIIDFSDPKHSYGINPTGQSGVFLDPHYADQSNMYADGEFREQSMDFDQIKLNSSSRMTFNPLN